jgi:DNA-binding transcriptional LysR family regulator
VELLHAGRKLRFMLDARRLRVLCAVADQPSLSAAAEALTYTPSAVSQSIVALERELGVKLLHRTARGVTLTEMGRTLVTHARPILEDLHEAQASLAAVAELRSGRLRLACFPTAGATILPRAISRFRTRHPAVELRLVQAGPDEAMRRLRAGDVDLIVTADAAPTETIQVVELVDDPFYVVLPVNHALVAHAELPLAALESERWVDTPPGTEARRLLVTVCRRAGFTPRVAFESDDYATVQELVAAGAGVALVPSLALRRPPPGVALRPLAGEPVSRRIMAALHVPQYRAPAAGAMLKVLQEAGAVA